MGSRPLLRRTVSTILALLALVATAVWAGCGAEPRQPPEPAPTDYSGTYEVRGHTTDVQTGAERDIAGTIVLVHDLEGKRYKSTYEFRTTWPTQAGDISAHIVGFSQGVVSDDRLEGDAHTQLLISEQPGSAAERAYVPETVTAVIESDTVSTITPDGEITVELENRGAAGDDYRPTRTRLEGRRSEG